MKCGNFLLVGCFGILSSGTPPRPVEHRACSQPKPLAAVVVESQKSCSDVY